MMKSVFPHRFPNSSNSLMPVDPKPLRRFFLMGCWLLLPAIVNGQTISSANSNERILRINAQSIRYSEDTNEMQIRDSVYINTDSIEISADALSMDTEKSILTGTGNITIQRGEDRFTTDQIRVDLEAETAEIKNIHVAIETPDIPKPLYIRASSITDRPSKKSGTSATLTSCSLPDPHYYVWTQYFDYKPDAYILTYNTFVYTPILGIPFFLWTPFYYFEVGKRSIIWNIPTIGRREFAGGGWFVQNTIDYDLSEDKSSSVFLDWFENKGIGSGIRHQYDLFGSTGSLYYYGLTDQKTQALTEKKAWSSEYTWEQAGISVNIESVNGERLTTVGRDQRDSRQLFFNWNDVGEQFSAYYRDQQDYIQNSGVLQLGTEYKFNGLSIAKFSHQSTSYKSQGAKIEQTRLETTTDLPEKTKLQLTSVFDRDIRNTDTDDRLISSLQLSKIFSDSLRANLTLDYSWDIDGDSVTRDVSSGRNNFLYALPKLVVSYSDPNPNPIQSNYEITLARFQEYNFDTNKNALRIYPNGSQFSAEPNTLILRSNATTSLQNIPLLGNIKSGLNYEQHVFRNPDRGWFDSDAEYMVNSPFFALNLSREQRNDISGTLTFFIFDENRYRWSHQSRFDWITSRWDTYITEAVVSPIPELYLNARTGKRLNPTAFEKSSRFLPFDFRASITSGNIKLNYDISFDLNSYIDQRKTNILQSSFTSGWTIGGTDDDRWELQSTLRYNTTGQPPVFDLSRYEINSISINKIDHCRTFRFGYNKILDEFIFQITILAFPQNPITIRRNRDSAKLQGVLDDPSQERL
ncbi:hypothetical protein EBR96_00010 [bacterium]|nr:hypothetical protein [bacterium]